MSEKLIMSKSGGGTASPEYTKHLYLGNMTYNSTDAQGRKRYSGTFNLTSATLNQYRTMAINIYSSNNWYWVVIGDCSLHFIDYCISTLNTGRFYNATILDGCYGGFDTYVPSKNNKIYIDYFLPSLTDQAKVYLFG